MRERTDLVRRLPWILLAFLAASVSLAGCVLSSPTGSPRSEGHCDHFSLKEEDTGRRSGLSAFLMTMPS